MGYLIKNTETDKFAARFGSGKAYTADALKAQRFRTRDAAERHRCGNEIIVDFGALLNASSSFIG